MVSKKLGGIRCSVRRRALPLPCTILALGTAASICVWKFLRYSRMKSITDEFDRDAGSVAFQITSRIVRDVEENYVASFTQHGSGPADALESWTAFTSDWLETHAEGTAVWAPRVKDGNSSAFNAQANREYLDYPGGVRIFTLSDEGERVYANGSETGDMWPILYMNPYAEFIGFDISGDAEGEAAIEKMLVMNDTVLPRVSMSSAGLPRYAVFQPVFEDAEIVGLCAQTTDIQVYCRDIVDSLGFEDRFDSADISVFLNVARANPFYQLLYNLKLDPNYTEEHLSGAFTPDGELNGRTFRFQIEVELTSNESVVVVASFKPKLSTFEGQIAVIVGCIASLLVALLVYGRQVLVLSYKYGMEKATFVSTFKSRFVADMSHEIRTPLNGIIGTAELLAEEKLDPSAADMVGTVRACSNILLGIVNDALNFAKIDVGQLKVEASPTVLRTTLLEVMQIMKATYRSPKGEKTADVRLRLQLDESVPEHEVLADVGRIRQVLVTLVSNSFKFTDAGSITVSARCEPLAHEEPEYVDTMPEDRCQCAVEVPMLMRRGSSLLPEEGEGGCVLRRRSSASVDGNRTRKVAVIPMRRRGRERSHLFSTSHRWLGRCKSSKLERQKQSRHLVFARSLRARTHKRAMLVVNVTDTGKGMTPSQMDHLFKPFSQVHGNKGRTVAGIGLGLTIAKALCESMGGALECRSSQGQGSTFQLSVLVGLSRVEGTCDICGKRKEGPEGDAMNDSPDDPIAAAVVAARRSLPSDEERPRETTCEWNLSVERTRSHTMRHPSARTLATRTSVETQRVGWEMITDDLLMSQDVRDSSGSCGTAASTREEKTGEVITTRELSRSDSVATVIRGEDLWFTSGPRSSDEDGGLQAESQKSSMALASGYRPRFLVVDDVRVNRLLVRKMLEPLDVEVELAEDGAEAVEACKKSRFSVIFMDVMMPVMGGLEATRAIRTEDERGVNRATPIIAITANPSVRGTEEGDQAGLTDLLVKPITRNSLFSSICKWANEDDVSWMGNAWRRRGDGRRVVLATRRSSEAASTLG